MLRATIIVFVRFVRLCVCFVPFRVSSALVRSFAGSSVAAGQMQSMMQHHAWCRGSCVDMWLSVCLDKCSKKESACPMASWVCALQVSSSSSSNMRRRKRQRRPKKKKALGCADRGRQRLLRSTTALGSSSVDGTRMMSNKQMKGENAPKLSGAAPSKIDGQLDPIPAIPALPGWDATDGVLLITPTNHCRGSDPTTCIIAFPSSKRPSLKSLS